ncbi:MAG: SLBB domain-containing protein [Fibrobacterota bacterium]
MKHIIFFILFFTVFYSFGNDELNIDSLRAAHEENESYDVDITYEEFLSQQRNGEIQGKNQGEDSEEQEKEDTLFFNELEETREFKTTLDPEDDTPLTRYGIEFLQRKKYNAVFMSPDSNGEDTLDQYDEDTLDQYDEENQEKYIDEYSYGPVNPDYRIGVGDEIIITLWGDVNLKESYEVGRTGTITPRGVGNISVVGLSLEDLEKKLLQRFSRVYSGVNYGRSNARTHLDVSMGQLRKKQVYIIGDVVNPGVYNIPTLMGPWGAVTFAGGVRKSGSLRDIYIRRDGKIIDTVDFYTYFRDTTNRENAPVANLSDYDIIEVSPIQKNISLSGAVNRPAIYELREEENLSDLISYAGGLLPEAYRGNCNIIRTFPGDERKTMTVSLDSLESIELYKNDSIHVEYIYEYDNTISISGPVNRPGTYAYEEGMKLSDLIEIAEGTEDDIFETRVEILRTHSDYSREIISTNLGQLLSGDESFDVELKEWDVVKLFSQWDIESRDYVVVKGEVKNPGKYFLRDGMSVQDLLLIAGGFTKKAYRDTVEISRFIKGDEFYGNETKSMRIAVDSAFFEHDNLDLQHLDYLFVRRDPNIGDQDVVTLSGEFVQPGHYAKQRDSETLLSLLKRSGGVKNSAYLRGARFIRRRNDIGIVSLDLERLLNREDERENIVLEDGDSIFIPTRPRTVRVEGEVFFPSAVKFVPRKPVRHYLSGAGGLTQEADKRSIYIIQANGEVASIRRGSRDITPGSKIVVGKKPEDYGISSREVLNFTQSVLGILTSTASLFLIMDRME